MSGLEDDLILVADRDGYYVDANEALLAATGYESVAEIRRLPPGSLSDADRAASAEVWHRFVAGELDFPPDRPVSLRRLDGAVVSAILTAVEPGALPGTWVIRMRLGSRPSVPPALHVILSQWREVERRLRETAADSPERRALASHAEELRGLFHAEARRREADRDATS